jgi:UDP-N-acetylglucosamine transferase subunit ALG13
LTLNKIYNVKPVALVAPLDWGLGHASRCIPIIKECLIAGFEVIIAAEGSQKALLQAEFPTLNIVNLKGYRLKYGSTKWLTILKIILQIPKILIAINREKKWLTEFTNNKHLDLVIADNRFGLCNTGIISVFVTHQLYIKTPFGKLVNKMVQKINYYFINHFNYCWIPDTENEINLGGELSHPHSIPLCKIRYIGILSRIKKENIATGNKLLILLSGPEPQRSIFETNLLGQLKKFSIPAFFVRGLPLSSNTISSTASLKIVNHFPGEQLQDIINKSEIIICRSGYTTIMEVVPLNKKCIFIPTPGQTEQEYLAGYLAGKGWACSAPQDKFSLPVLIQEAGSLQVPDLSVLTDSGRLKEAIKEIADTIKSHG